MKAAVETPDATQRVGKFEFRVAAEKSASEGEDHRAQRIEALRAWLLAQWQREQAVRN